MNPYQNVNLSAGAQAVPQETELQAVHDRLDRILSRLWQSNESMYAAADRISGGALQTAGKDVAPPPQRPGILGRIEKTIESMEEAASALEDRAAYFSRLG